MAWINCKQIAQRIDHETASLIKEMPNTEAILAIVQCNEDGSSRSYAKQICAQAYKLGITIVTYKTRALLGEYRTVIEDLNKDDLVNGIAVLNIGQQLCNAHSYIAPRKNVEGNDFDDNLNRVSCTAKACLEVIKTSNNVSFKDSKACVIGYGKAVGKPVAYLLMRAHVSSVILTHRYTNNLDECLKGANIIISATGEPGLIWAHMVCPGSIVIDVGFSEELGKISGDVRKNVATVADVTPVPGGIGLITTSLLLQNVALAALGRY